MRACVVASVLRLFFSCGCASHPFTRSFGRSIPLVAQARLRVHQNLGHCMHITSAAKVLPEIVAFLCDPTGDDDAGF